MLIGYKKLKILVAFPILDAVDEIVGVVRRGMAARALAISWRLTATKSLMNSSPNAARRVVILLQGIQRPLQPGGQVLHVLHPVGYPRHCGWRLDPVADAVEPAATVLAMTR